MNCKNCGNGIKGQFCSQDGQSTKVDRINLSNFIREMSESIFYINKGFFFTLKELTVRPGHSLKGFLAGQRKNHFKPIAYVFTLSTIYFLVTQTTDQSTWVDEIISGWLSGISDNSEAEEFPFILMWLSMNYGYATLLLLPVFSLASYFSFLPFGKNYLEHIVINSYVTGQLAISYTIFAIARSLIDYETLEVLPMVVAILYTCWVFWQVFSKGNRIVNILRSLLTYLLYLVFSFLLLIAIMGIHGIT